MYYGLGRPGGFPHGEIRRGILERLRVASRQPVLSSFEESQESMVEELWEQIGQFQGDQLSMQIRQGLNMPPEEVSDATLADLMRIMMDRDETLEDLNIPVVSGGAKQHERVGGGAPRCLPTSPALAA